MRKRVQSEPDVERETEGAAAKALIRESHRLIDQSHELLQAAQLVLNRSEPRYPMPVRLKRVAA